MIGDIVQAPQEGDYARAAQSSLPVAAALAPALFLLRLALYHWGRLLGEDDSGLQVIGDWVTAGVLAVVAGPFLDMVVRLGWWMQGKVLGETSGLAMQFVEFHHRDLLCAGHLQPDFLWRGADPGTLARFARGHRGLVVCLCLRQRRAIRSVHLGRAPGGGQCGAAGPVAPLVMDQGPADHCPAADCGGRHLQGRAGQQSISSTARACFPA